MPLADLHDTFNLAELHKGWFPHTFHTKENLIYRGCIPAKQYFQPQAMKPPKRKAFDTWYDAELARNDEYVNLARVKEVLSFRCDGIERSLSKVYTRI